jgi:WD40 repeat protein
MLWMAGIVAMLFNAPVSAVAEKAISFRADIAPILQAKCVTCHNAEKAKGGYRLHTFTELMKPGESKEPPVVPGQLKASKLHSLLITSDADDRMPQKDDPLPAAQIELVASWIMQGAKFDGVDSNALLSALTTAARHPDPPARYLRPEPILALAFRPDGAQLAASGYHEVTLWDSADGTLLQRLPNLPRQIHALAFSPGGEFLAVAGGTSGRSGEIRIIDLSKGTSVRALATAGDVFLSLAFSPDGQRLVGGGADNTIRVLETITGNELQRIEQHADWVMGLAYAPDGSHFASASRDKTARLFDAKSGELEETYDGHGQIVFAVAFGADSKRVFSAGRDREIHAWSTKDARRSLAVRGIDGDVLRIAVVGDQIFSAGTDRMVRQHRLQDKKAEAVRAFAGHRDVVYSLAVHADSKRIASGSFDGEVRVWNSTTGDAVTNFFAAPGYSADH